jgi:segregation and condensation protein B
VSEERQEASPARAGAEDVHSTGSSPATGALRGEGEVSRAGRPEPQDGSASAAADDPAAAPPQPPLPALLEAVLLVTDEPVPAVTLAQVVERPTAEVEEALGALATEYAAQGRGFELRAVAGGWRLYTRPDCAPWVERFVLDGQQARLTQAALETLAVVAYRQPVTRARVSAVRGVNVDGVVRTLVARGLVIEVGADAESGATLYGTTPLLLEKLGLGSLDQLPSLAPLLPEIDDMVEGSTST